MKGLLANRKALVGTSLLAIAATFGAGQMIWSGAVAQNTHTVTAPRFEVDPFFPKPLPDNGLLGQAIGVAVDSQNNIWMIHRGWDETQLDNTELATPLTGARAGMYVGERGVGAPAILQFDQEGNLLRGWGPIEGEGISWPLSNHGIAVDSEGFVYIGGNGASDSQVLKFTSDGVFVTAFGEPAARAVTTPAADPAAAPTVTYVRDSFDMTSFGRVADIDLVEDANEAYLADGYLNRRVAVVDMDTGEIKRFWGAYGNPPDDQNLPAYDPAAPLSTIFRNPVHCATPSLDGFVYVCDRSNDRIQVFTKAGEYVNEVRVAPETLADGSVWDIALSADDAQAYMYVADGVNNHIRVFDRATLTEIYNFGITGRGPGQFLGVHSIIVDHDGNIYTTETYTGKRIQRHNFLGVQTFEVTDGQRAE